MRLEIEFWIDNGSSDASFCAAVRGEGICHSFYCCCSFDF